MENNDVVDRWLCLLRMIAQVMDNSAGGETPGTVAGVLSWVDILKATKQSASTDDYRFNTVGREPVEL